VLLLHLSQSSVSKMAAALTVPSAVNHGGIGAYKDFATTTYSADAELKGTEQVPPASFPNYLPVWDKETK
jgi:hypothetical protein